MPEQTHILEAPRRTCSCGRRDNRADSDITRCDNCNRLTCEHCYQLCSDCGESFCPVCYSICDRCREAYCESCSIMHECASCNRQFCRSCDDDLTYCSVCGDYYCDRCGCNCADEVINPYGYKPNPIFAGSGSNRYYGVELEITSKTGDTEECAKDICDITDRVYCKEDGSLNRNGYDGFEIVSHPATLDYHLSSGQWEQICKTASRHKFVSHDSGLCGMHVHVSRDALNDAALWGLKAFYVANRDRIVKFSHRKWHQINEYAAIPEENRSEDWRSNGRYSAINITSETVEFRHFNGTINYDTFKQNLIWLDELINAANADELCLLTWRDLADRFTEQNPDIKERMLSCV